MKTPNLRHYCYLDKYLVLQIDKKNIGITLKKIMK